MTERLVSKRLFWQTPVSGTAVSGPQSSAIDLRVGVTRLESLTWQASSPSSNPDLSIWYRISPDGASFGSYSDFTALLASTISYTTGAAANPQGYQTVALPLPLAPFIQFHFSGVGSNPQDVLVTADLWLRMTP